MSGYLGRYCDFNLQVRMIQASDLDGRRHGVRLRKELLADISRCHELFDIRYVLGWRYDI